MFKTVQQRLGCSPGTSAYLRSRRTRKLISNIVVVLLLSGVTAFVITRQSGGAGFSLPKSVGIANSDKLTSSPAAESQSALPEETSREAADGYKLETGPLAVTEVSDIVLHDEKRNKDLHVRIFYPVQQGKYPVIVFSHGAGGSESCCESLTRHWATYGYITMQPTHDDSIVQRRDTGDDTLRFPQAVRDA